jgi:eukaryotic-like serine/threonine-protein kinase
VSHGGSRAGDPSASARSSCAQIGLVMTPERWQEMKSLLAQALELKREDQCAFLDGACSSDPELRAEIDSLLSEEELVRSKFLESPRHLDNFEDGESEFKAGLSAGQIFVERFQLIRKLGEGGMGQVWLAEQTSPVRRPVAVKLIRAGMYDESVVKRFQAERQSVAMMDHPAIAKVFEAGATPLGQPYFVMEYVPGVPITAYCDLKKLKIEERLRLFIQACEGVQHAHQKAIIHRDLKPANILVVEVDAQPVPRIIDFGLARAATPQLDANTVFTQVGQLVGTPGYMSPEQADPNLKDIDTRTDVYSLGAILYVLLAGSEPFDAKTGENLPLDEWLRRLREEDPPTPSTKVSSNRQTSSVTAKERGTEAGQLVKLLRGDLDWITMKALEKDRGRRYGTPSELAADTKRYLNHEAVLAVPPSLKYRAGKFARRYRAPLATTAAFALVLVAAAVFSTRQSIRANREAAVAEAVNEFLENDLLAQASVTAQSGPGAKPDPDLKVRTALDRAAARVENKFTKQPEVEASIRETIGRTYLDLGLYAEGRKQLQRALELRRRVLGTEDAKTLKSVWLLGRVAFLQGRFAEAEALDSQALEAQRRIFGPEHPDSLRSVSDLAFVYDREGKFALAEALFAQTLEVRKRVLGPEHRDSLQSMNGLGLVYIHEGKFPEAEALFTQALEIWKRVSGPEHPDTLTVMANLMNAYLNENKYAQAEALAVQTLEIRKRLLGPEHPVTLVSMASLATVYDHERKYSQAEALLTETLEIWKRVLGPEHPDTLAVMGNLAQVYLDEGNYAQAETFFNRTFEIMKRVLGPENPYTAITLYNLGCLAARQGKKDQAISMLGQSVDHGLLPRVDLAIGNDADLTSLHGDPRFAALVAHAKQVAEAERSSSVAQASR